MHDQAKDLTPVESIDIIQRMIQTTKTNFNNEYSFHYLFWGWLLTAAALLHFVLLKTQLAGYSFLPWPIFAIGGIVISIIYSRKKWQKEKSETYLGNFMEVFFTTGCLLYFIGVFICVANNISPNPIIMLISGFYGIVSGRLLKFIPFIWGGAIFILLSIVANFVTMENQLLLIAASFVAGFLIPGYMLKSKTKNSRN